MYFQHFSFPEPIALYKSECSNELLWQIIPLFKNILSRENSSDS